MTFSNSDTEFVLTLGIEDEQLFYSSCLSTDLDKFIVMVIVFFMVIEIISFDT